DNPTVGWVVAATLVLAAALGIGRFAYTPLLPDMVALYHWQFAQAGDVASANFLGYMVGAMLAARVAQHPQLRLWVAASLMASALTTVAGAWASTFPVWLLVRFLSGVASAFCLVLVTTQLIYVLANERAERLGNVHFAGVGLGIVLCMVIVYQPATVPLHWQHLGGCAALLMLVAWLLLSGDPIESGWSASAPASAAPDAAAADHGTNGIALWRVVLGYGMFGYGYVVAATFLVAMAEVVQAELVQAEQVSQQTAFIALDTKSVWLVVGLALIPSVYVWQWWANKHGIYHALRIAYVVECVGLVLAGLSQSYLWLMVAAVLLGGTFAAITALGISAARYAAPERIAYAVSAMTTAFAFGQLLGPAVSGRLADYFGDFFWASISAGMLLLLAAALLRPNLARR
ncbi:MAG: YbfB/YjiJ family MFS transporter, partial [Pseudomonadota bacterium]